MMQVSSADAMTVGSLRSLSLSVIYSTHATTKTTSRRSLSRCGTSRLFLVGIERTTQRVVGLFWWESSRRLNELWGFAGHFIALT